MGSFHPRYANFSEKTTLYGFRELHESKRWPLRCFWIVLITSSTAAMCVHIYAQMDQYLGDETVTKTSRFQPGRKWSPLILLRLSNSTWMDVAKIRELNLTYEEIQVARGYMVPNLEFDSDEIPFDQALESLRIKMDKMAIGEVTQLAPKIVWKHFGSEATNSSSVVSTGFINGEGRYVLNSSLAETSEYAKTWQFVWTFNFTAYDQNIRRTFDFLKLEHQDRRNVAEPQLFNPDTNQVMPIDPDYKYLINVECRVYRQLSNCRRDVDDNVRYYTATCNLDCTLKAEMARNLRSCYKTNHEANLELTDHYRNGLISLCHLGATVNGSAGYGAEEPQVANLTESERVELYKEIKQCRATCLPKCEQWTTTWGLMSYPRRPYEQDWANSAKIAVNFPNSDALLITEEVERYKWHDVVSNVGGLMGLWMGAGVMSLFQVIHLCCWGAE